MAIRVYDIETAKSPDETEAGWKDPRALGLGSAVVYDYDSDHYHFFIQGQEDVLIDYLSGAQVVSFNGIRFDNKVLLGNDYDLNKCPWENLDLYDWAVRSRFGCSLEEALKQYSTFVVYDGNYSLGAICERTLGMKKSGKGALAPVLLREGRLAEVLAYNLNDVRLTKKLFEHMLRHRSFSSGARDTWELKTE